MGRWQKMSGHYVPRQLQAEVWAGGCEVQSAFQVSLLSITCLRDAGLDT